MQMVQLSLETIDGFPSQMFVLVVQGGFLDFLPVMENSRKTQKAKYLCGDECVCVCVCCSWAGPSPPAACLDLNQWFHSWRPTPRGSWVTLQLLSHRLSLGMRPGWFSH